MNLRRVSISAILVALFAITANASACELPQQTVIRVAALLGDVYNQFANDGEELSSSYSAALAYQRSTLRAEAILHRSVYVTENLGSGSLTAFPTLDGGMAAVPFFQASESTSEIHITHCAGRRLLAVGIGYAQTSTNYGYPHLRGLGVGVVRDGSPRRIQIRGSLFLYPAIQGRYVVPASGRTLLLTFGLVTFDGSIAWHIGSSPVSLEAGLYQELRYQHPYARPTLLIRASPFIGFAVHLRP